MGHGCREFNGIDILRETNSIITITLDWLLEQGPPPHVVKIDVEGAELNVLKGGLRLLKEVHPAILCEVANEEVKGEVSRLLLENNYSLYDWDSPQRDKVTICMYNTLALPRSA